MNEEIAQQILQELTSSLETLEAQTAAILQFLNNKKAADKKALAAYLEQAGQASSVRWRASRARIDRLLSSAMKSIDEGPKKKEAPKPESDQVKENGEQPDHEENLQTKGDGERNEGNGDAEKSASASKPKAEDVRAGTDKDESNPPERNEDGRNQSGENEQRARDTNKDTTEKAA